jgi:hypothetical protein
MSLMKYLILEFLDVRHTNPSFVPQHIFVIFQETRRLFFVDVALYFLDLPIF